MTITGYDTPRAQRFHNRLDLVRSYYNQSASSRKDYVVRNEYFYRKIADLFNFIIEPKSRVAQIGCQTGHLLSQLNGAERVGFDSSDKLLEIAEKDHPDIAFHRVDDSFDGHGEFDYVVVSNAAEMVDPMNTFKNIKSITAEDGRVIIYHYNHLWEPVVKLSEKLGIKYPPPLQNWYGDHDITQILDLAGLEIVKTYGKFLCPKPVFGLSWLLNDIIGHLPLVHRLTLSKVIVARPRKNSKKINDVSVSIIVPCRNEVGNVDDAVRRIPQMGCETEILFCDDKSTDGTADAVRRLIEENPDKNIRLIDGPGICKSQNVYTGFDNATGDILMILDADLTTMPEELPHFFEVIRSGQADFVNGTRLIFPMDDEAMRPFNIIGNRLFSKVFTFILGQRITDTLCGTKVIWRKDWPRIKSLTGTWGIDDRWGDFDLIFGAAIRHMKIVDLPVHYVDRVSGVTKMNNRINNGIRMLKMCIAAYKRFNSY